MANPLGLGFQMNFNETGAEFCKVFEYIALIVPLVPTIFWHATRVCGIAIGT